MIITPQFDYAEDFWFGRANVVVGKRSAIIGTRGEFLINPEFAHILPFSHDLFFAWPGEWDDRFETSFSHFNRKSNINRYGMSIPAGIWSLKKDTWLLEPHWYLKNSVNYPDNKRRHVWAKEGENGLFGLMKNDGTWIVKPQYSVVDSFKEGRAVVGLRSDDNSAMRYGIIDEEGNIITPMIWENIKDYNENK